MHYWQQIYMEWKVTKAEHPNKGHTLNKGQRGMYMYEGVRYSESPLFIPPVPYAR